MKNLLHEHLDLSQEIKNNIKENLNKLANFRSDMKNNKEIDFFKNKYYEIDENTKLKVKKAEHDFFSGLKFICELFIIENQNHDICASFTAFYYSGRIYCIRYLKIEVVFSEKNSIKD